MKKLAAFTVLEITLVMALTSVLMSILFSTLNGFNITIANEVKIKSELNDYFMLRSTIWKDLDQMDSVKLTDKNHLILFNGGQQILYTSSNESLLRSTKNGEKQFNIPIREINMNRTDGVKKLRFIFDWKTQETVLSYPIQLSPNESINDYFLSNKWQIQ